MGLVSFGYRLMSESSPFMDMLEAAPEDTSRVLFAGWTSFVIGAETAGTAIPIDQNQTHRNLD